MNNEQLIIEAIDRITSAIRCLSLSTALIGLAIIIAIISNAISNVVRK